MTKYRSHHPKAAIERMTLPRNRGGRGIVGIANQLKTQIANLRAYFYQKSTTSELHRAVVEADIKATPLNLADRTAESTLITLEQQMAAWNRKELHGRYPNVVNSQYVDQQASYKWLTTGSLYTETEGFMIAIQDEVIATKNYRKYIIRDSQLSDDKCRKCKAASETIQHILGGCGVLTQTDYKARHDTMGKIVHRALALHHKLVPPPVEPYYRYSPATILENENIKLYWDRTIYTDRSVPHNRPDITLWDKKQRRVYLIDFAVVNNNNLQSTYNTKISKYQDIAEEIKALWQVQSVTIVPIIISTTGVVPITLRQDLKTLSLNEGLYAEMQKSVIISSCSTVRRFLNLTM